MLKKACTSAADIKNVRATLIPGDVVAPEVSSLIDVAEKFVVDLAVAWYAQQWDVLEHEINAQTAHAAYDESLEDEPNTELLQGLYRVANKPGTPLVSMAATSAAVQDAMKLVKSLKKIAVAGGLTTEVAFDARFQAVDQPLKKIKYYLTLIQTIKLVVDILPGKEKRTELAATEREHWKAAEREGVAMHPKIKDWVREEVAKLKKGLDETGAGDD